MNYVIQIFKLPVIFLIYILLHPTNKQEIGSGKGVLFILDGWDELPAKCKGEYSFFQKLIRGDHLKECSIIITSRPSATANN